ncbi:hypothetical protein E1A91_A01G030200v1 [Gossypium mustelinum]|uniref:Uncharacterized protein n=1 Tax=Gossypium mustelinum TaxID=34275 RepID=A0A5D3A921_GOSMU|nr:hypothetical protein E1A91_A01G030200v1 [Gossypium mustelinum]
MMMNRMMMQFLYIMTKVLKIEMFHPVLLFQLLDQPWEGSHQYQTGQRLQCKNT